jgi:APA family basic amino acid/polyamine antiporter
MAEGQTLRRDLSLAQAVAVGVGAMVGGGIPLTFSQSLDASQRGIWPALGLAALVALMNGLSSGQCAVRYPTSGGTFEYASELIHPAAGWIAGWAFVISKVAAAASIALLLGLQPFFATTPMPPLVWSLGFLILLIAANLVGIKKIGALNLAIVAITVGGWLVWCTLLFLAGPIREEAAAPSVEPRWVLSAAGLMFFAFTGYARIATLAEEVRDPTRTIPRAIILSIGVVTGLYVLILSALIHRTGFLAGSEGEPVNRFWQAMSNVGGAENLLTLVLATSMIGVLLSQVLSVSRVLLAMARRGGLPSGFTRVGATGVPTPMILVTGGLMIALTLVGGFELTLPLAVASILVYYGLTHLAVLRIRGDDPPYSKFVAVVGLIGCVVLGLAVIFIR